MDTLLDYGLLRGLLTVIVFGAFVGVFIWAYSSRRKQDFDAAARLPLENDHGE